MHDTEIKGRLFPYNILHGNDSFRSRFHCFSNSIFKNFDRKKKQTTNTCAFEKTR